MRLRFEAFSGEDDEAFEATKSQLVDEFDRWLAERREPDDGGLASNAELLLDWRYSYSSGELDRYENWEIGEFLLEWCPRKVSAPPEFAFDACRGVARFVEFMAATDRLVGGSRRAAELVELIEQATPEMHRAMGDRSKFGMAKSMFAGALDGLDSIDDPAELQRFLDQRMAEFNALPFEERKALTDPALAAMGGIPFELPFVHIPSLPADVLAAAEAAPILAQFDALREYLGSDGKALTDKGNIKLADGRALVELLDTGDRFDGAIGDRTFKTKSTDELRGLHVVVELAKKAGAVRVNRGRIVPVKAWVKRDRVDHAVAVFRALAGEGPLWMRFGDSFAFNAIAEVVDDGLVHWLTMLLGADEIPFDEVVAVTLETVRDAVTLDAQFWTEAMVERSTRSDLARTVDLLELVGVIAWTGRVEERNDYGTTDRSGGMLALTALGRHALPLLVPDYGYRIRTIESLAEADVEQLLEAMEEVIDEQVETLVATWQPAVDVGRRAEQVAEAIVATARANRRLLAMAVFEALGPEASEPYVRSLLDTHVAGHAALWLMAHDFAELDELGHLVGIGVMVDVLAATLDDPEELCELFLASPTHGDAEHALQLMWRHDSPDTAAVLDALGKRLPDRRLAKAARKAALQHRSWMASRT